MDNFRAEIHRSLTQPILIGGAPREFTIINLTFGAAFVFGLQSLFAVPVVILTHLGAVVLATKDPNFLETFKRHINHKSYYDV